MDDPLINIGEITGVFGIKGGVKVFSLTEPRDNILSYTPWLLQKNNQTRKINVINGNIQGKGVIAYLEDINDRDIAFALIGSKIFIERYQLPPTDENEFYWTDLIGLNVETTHGIHLGHVTQMMETGSNDVLIVHDGKTERLIPFLQGSVVKEVNLVNKRLVADWDPDF